MENPESEIFQELEPFLRFKPEAFNKLAKARANLKLTLELERLRMSMETKSGENQANIVVVAPENLDDKEIFNETATFAAPGSLAGNYGIAANQDIKMFYGDTMPTYKPNNSDSN